MLPRVWRSKCCGEADLDRDSAEDAGDSLEHFRDGGAAVGGACHEVFLATPSNAEMALMILVDLDMLEGAREVEDKQAVGFGKDVPVSVEHRGSEGKGDFFEFGVQGAHVDD
ncbi:MAG: hypothetical protein QGG01_02855 [Roseibacillus sp.]|nr:hypothetical protein [Roseibacillus sp.]